MNTEVLALYKKLRQPHVGRYRGSGKIYHFQVGAEQALRSARYEFDTLSRWTEAEDNGLVRFRVEPDPYACIEDLAGDTFNPEANPDISPERLEREYKEFIDKVNREGVYGIVGEYFNGESWEVGDSVWGFVGFDGYEGSGYDLDIKSGTLDHLAQVQHCPHCGRPTVQS